MLFINCFRNFSKFRLVLYWRYYCCCFLVPFQLFSQHVRITAPVAQKVPFKITINGETRLDNYYWFKNRDKSEVINYLKEENEYALKNGFDTSLVAKQIISEFDKTIYKKANVPSLVSADSVHNGFTIIDLNKDKKGSYPFLCKRDLGSQKVDSLVNIDLIAKKFKYFKYYLSYNSDYSSMAFLVDTNGTELYSCTFLNLLYSKWYKERIPRMTNYCEWADDGSSFLYGTVDSVNLRWNRIQLHKLGKLVAEDKLIYEEQNQTCNTYITKDESKKLLLINSENRNTSFQQYLDASGPEKPLKKVSSFEDGVIIKINAYQNNIYILTNYKAPNFRILKTSIEHPSKIEECKDLISESDTTVIEHFHVVGNFLITEERKWGLPAIHVYNLFKGTNHYIHFPEANFSVSLRPILQESQNVEITYSSFNRPPETIIYSLKDETQTKYSYTLTDTSFFKPENYELKMIYVLSSDNVKIPITLFYKKSIQIDKNTPLLLEAYGSFSKVINTGFDYSIIPLVNRGFIYAIAHVRGGGEFGENWHKQGRGNNKKKSVQDFIRCSEFLIKNSYTNSDKLFITGGSAGALVIASAAVLKPELYKALAIRVPFLDLITTMADSTLPGTKVDFGEFGNPYEKKIYKTMLSYSPYDNIRRKQFPSMLIRSSFNDTRVMYWEATKFVAKIREHQQLKTNKILLQTDLEGGHYRRNFRKEYAGNYAFFISLLNNY